MIIMIMIIRMIMLIGMIMICDDDNDIVNDIDNNRDNDMIMPLIMTMIIMIMIYDNDIWYWYTILIYMSCYCNDMIIVDNVKW